MCDVLDFLSSLFDEGLGYSALNTARSALSSMVTLHQSPFTIGTHPWIIRFLKGVFNERPSQPRYKTTWDVAVVLGFLRTLPDYCNISLKLLTWKLIMLCLLVTGNRGQTIHLLNLDNHQKTDSAYIFKIVQPIKQSRPGKPLPIVELKAYSPDKRLCVYTCLETYIERTATLREQTTQLFISYTKPYSPISRSTISRWAKATMLAAGIDTKVFKAHSIRAASASAAYARATPLDCILKTAGWQKSDTFSKFYKKDIQTVDNYASNVLSATHIHV